MLPQLILLRCVNPQHYHWYATAHLPLRMTTAGNDLSRFLWAICSDFSLLKADELW